MTCDYCQNWGKSSYGFGMEKKVSKMSYFKAHIKRVPPDSLPGCVPDEATPVVEIPINLEGKANPYLKLLKGLHLTPWEFAREGGTIYIFRKAARLFLERIEFGCRGCGERITGADILSAAEEEE